MKYSDLTLDFSRGIYATFTGCDARNHGNLPCFRRGCTGSQASLSMDKTQGKVLLHCFRCNFGGTMIDFLEELGHSRKEIYRILGISPSEKEKKNYSFVDSALNTLKSFYPSYSVSEKEIYYFDFMDVKRFGVFLQEVNLNLENPLKGYTSIKPFAKCVLRNLKGEKEFRLVYQQKDKIAISEKGELIVFPYNFMALFEWMKDANDKRIIIITEGEKDVETIKSLVGSRCLPISLKTGDTFWKMLVFYMIAKKTDCVYFLGDNDTAGYKHRKDLFIKARGFLKHFYIVRLTNIEKLGRGADITDWYDDLMKNESRSTIRNLLEECIFQKTRLQDMMLSEHFEAISEVRYDKEGNVKSITPENTWVNIRSFFESKEAFLMRDIMTGKVHGEYGLLRFMKGDNALTLFPSSIQAELMYAGWHNLSTKNVETLMMEYFEKRTFIHMLDEIKKKPINNLIIQKKFHDNFSSLKFPPLLLWLLNNIGFSHQEHCINIALQKTMIFKALLGLPYMLENTNDKGRRIKGELRFVGDNSVGKSTFCESLFEVFCDGKRYRWSQTMKALDIKNKDEVKVSFEAPCLIIDEGNLKGSNDEKKSFLDESLYTFIPKFKEISEYKIRRNIILSSSNNFINTYDNDSERRMWQICVDKLPYLLQLPSEEFYNNRDFWERNGVFESDLFTARDEDDENDVRLFKFPVLEFWRQMYRVYKEYEEKGIIENILILSTKSEGELEAYKNYMKDKTFVPEEEQFVLNMFGEENFKNAEDECDDIIIMPAIEFEAIIELFCGKSWVKKVKKYFTRLIKRFKKRGILHSNKTTYYAQYETNYINSVYVPLFTQEFVNNLEWEVKSRDGTYSHVGVTIKNYKLLCAGGGRDEVMHNYSRYQGNFSLSKYRMKDM